MSSTSFAIISTLVVTSVVVGLGGIIFQHTILVPHAKVQLPPTMRALLLHGQGNKTHLPPLRVGVVPMPKPGPGQILVKVEAAPVNPSDLQHAQGLIAKAARGGNYDDGLPFGFEGSGLVVASGAGFFSWMKLGKRVAFACHGGSFAEYVLVDALNTMDLPADVTYVEGASGIINPMTVQAMIDIAESGGHQCIVNTAAASSLGKMLVKYCLEHHVPLINVVRSTEQKNALVALGAHPYRVLVSSEESFVSKLASLSAELKASVAFDAVGGNLTGQLMEAIVSGGVVYVYGALAHEPVGGLPPQFYLQRKSLRGLVLDDWFEATSFINAVQRMNHAAAHLTNIFKTDYTGEFSLDDAPEAISKYQASATNRKIVIRPHVRSPS